MTVARLALTLHRIAPQRRPARHRIHHSAERLHRGKICQEVGIGFGLAVLALLLVVLVVHTGGAAPPLVGNRADLAAWPHNRLEMSVAPDPALIHVMPVP